MPFFVDIATDSLNKINEELCGDNVEIVKNDVSTIIVLADGLGSGVKANILATLTSNIAAQMLKLGSDIFDVVDTLEKTLPECKVRKLAYSTFTIIQIFNDGQIYIVEFDNPRIVFIRDGQMYKPKSNSIKFKNKDIYETRDYIKLGDAIIAFSDGVIHAGVGRTLNLGWQWNEVSDFLSRVAVVEKNATNISKELIEICNIFYEDAPGDDTTSVVIKIRKEERVRLFSGPPKDVQKDKIVAEFLSNTNCKTIVCGGTAANIIAREFGKDVSTDLSTLTRVTPPIGRIEGIDLVTEGVLTISETVKIIEGYRNNEIDKKIFKGKNGAAMLADFLVNQCTHLEVIMGNSMNPAHQNPNFPDQLGIKWKVTQQLIDSIEQLGKEVNIKYL